MLPEKQTEEKLDSPNVLLYVIILCVHYPLRILSLIYNLSTKILFKTLSLPRQLLAYSLSALTTIEELLETKIINLLSYLGTIPSFLFERVSNVILDLFVRLNLRKVSIFDYFLSLLERAINKSLTTIHTLEKVCIKVSSLPVQILIFCLKLVKSLIHTTLIMSEPPKETDQKTVEAKTKSDFVLDAYLWLKVTVLNCANLILTMIETITLQISDLVGSTPRHIQNLIITLLNRCQQIVLISILVAYNVGEYVVYYLMFLFSMVIKPISNNKTNEKIQNEDSEIKLKAERGNLKQEIEKLREALSNAMQKSENYDYEEKIKNLEEQLNEATAQFEKERAQYKREIEKLRQSENNIKKSDNFNAERKKLQGEIQRLQKLIAEVKQENENESKLKKQEAINLDNERNQLQERIQHLQQQVVILQKQNENNALRYEESLKHQEEEFVRERSQLQEKLQMLERKVDELEKEESEGKQNYLDNHTADEVKFNNTDDDKTSQTSNVTSSNKKKKVAT